MERVLNFKVCLAILIVLYGMVIVGSFYAEQGLDSEVVGESFDHQGHAAWLDTLGLKLECSYCHLSKAGDEPVLPKVKVCMDCHWVSAKEEPQIVRLSKMKKDSVPWRSINRVDIKVNMMHDKHLKFDCIECHMGYDHNMGMKNNHEMRDCISCHKREKAVTDCVVCHF